MKIIHLTLPTISVTHLKAGDILSLSGQIYTARDAAHKLMCDAIAESKSLPFDITNQAIYYAGPTATRPDTIIGSCGPTTAQRMDEFTPHLLEKGLRVMIGKGNRNNAVIASIIKNKAVYLSCVGGAAALISSKITSAEPIAYPHLGCEQILRLTVKDLPAVVSIDSRGNVFGQ